MKKYIEILKIGINAIIVYRFDVISRVIFSFGKIILAFILWRAVFGSKETIAGYNFNMMISYYIIVSFLSKVNQSAEVGAEYAEDIRSGKFTKYIVRPVRVLGYFMSVCLSRSLYFITFSIFGIVLSGLIFKDYFIVVLNPYVILPAVLCWILGLIFLILFDYFIAILSFWFLDISALFVLKVNLMIFLTGSLIPLNLLSESIVSVFKLLPFYYTSYYPVSMYISNNAEGAGTAIITMLIWIAVMVMINVSIYKRALKAYEGVGI